MEAYELCYGVSLSLELAGAIILLINFLGNTKKIVILTYFPGSNVAERKNDEIILKKNKLQERARNVYMNRTAFIYIIIGYISGIWSNMGKTNKFAIALMIGIVCFVLTMAGNAISKKIAEKKFEKDIAISFDSVKEIVDIPISKEEIDGLF